MDNAAVTDLSEARDRFARRRPAVLGAASPPLPVTELPTGTVTFLLTDIVDSTPMWEAHPRAMAEAVARHYEILDEAVAAHDGVRPVEQGEGDSMVAVFRRVSDAAAAAVAAQRALTAQPWPDPVHLEVRMGVHTGEAELRAATYYTGTSIIRCARLRALAHAGQVLVSGAAARVLTDTPTAGVGLLALGAYPLTGMRGTEEVHQILHAELRAEFPPPLAARPRMRLPVPVTSFVGRVAEVVELIDLTTRHRLVTAAGPGGCGKTRLALEVAADLADMFADGVCWVELAEISDPDAVPAAVLDALGVDRRGVAPVDRLTDYLTDRQILLVLDNCEHLVAAVAALVAQVMSRCAHTVVLATSREPLGVGGEQVWRIGPLSLPPEVTDGEADVAAVGAAESVQLFCERAQAARAGFQLDAGNAATVAALCRRLDGVPLGIELAAARVGALSPERILTGLADSFRLLNRSVRGAPSRQQTIAGCVQWSHDLLEPAEQVLLRRLAVFRGPFGIDAAEAITSDPDLHSDDVLAALAVLVDKSLVAFDGRGYGLLSPVREFARRRLLEAGEAEGVHDAHLAEFVRVAAQAATELAAAPQIATLNALDETRVDLTAAVDWALHRGKPDVAAALVTDLALFWQLRGRHGESVIRVRHVLAALPDDPSAVRAGLLWAAGQLGAAAMDLPGGYGIAETTAAVELATRHDYRFALGRALGMQALMAALGAPPMAPDLARQARAAAAAAGDPFGVTIADVYAGFATIWACARPDLAEEWMTGLHKAATDTGSPLWMAWRDLIVGIGHWRQGRLAGAIDALTAAESAAWALGEPVLESWCAAWAADAMIEAGRLEAAAEMLRRSAAWMDRSSWARLEWVLFRRATLALACGDLDGAQTALDAVIPVLSATGFGFVSLELALIRGRIAMYRGDLADAIAAEEEAIQLTATVPMPWYLTRVANATGRLRRAQDRRIDAETAHHQALALCLEHGFALVAADTLDCLTHLAADAESWTEAARLLGAADGLRERTGAVIPALDAAARDDVTAGIAKALGPESFEQARAAGYSLDLAEAIAYTARARGERKRPSTGWDSLTRTELMVVELAAQGLTNNQIADRLLIVPGTAKIHLHHIFAKLGITRRAELASRATERRLTAE